MNKPADNIIDARTRFQLRTPWRPIDTVQVTSSYSVIDDINIILEMLWPFTTCAKNTRERE